jgi:hypothetical protein
MEDSLKGGNAYRTFTEHDPKTGEIVVYGEARREPPTAEWGVIIGDIVHTLRSALDHLVWQLTLAEGHVPPSQISGKWRKIVFPILMEDPRRKDKESKKRIPWQNEPPDSLWGVKPSLHSLFESYQPFMRKGDPTLVQLEMDDPSYAPLAILNNLWNIDKHRHLHLTHFYAGLHEVCGPSPHPMIPGIESLGRTLDCKGSFEGRTEFTRLSWNGGPVPSEVEQHIKPTVFFDIAFEYGPPAHGARVTDLLEGLLHDVFGIVRVFQSHLEDKRTEPTDLLED